MSEKINFKDKSIDEILAVLDSEENKVSDDTTITRVATHFLQYRLHKELLDEQRKFQSRHLKRTTWLVLATWALVIVTILSLIYRY
ncbi:MAG TPA: hypothetical protein DCX95_06245 [Elusimicrobia bacterium]|nr:hypothetical protein [Elusimicrobiota bacterium]